MRLQSSYFRLKTLSVLIVTGLYLPNFSLAEPIDAFPLVNSLPVIRVAVNTGPGHGHQSASATVVTRLRQLGYRGEIEVVYPNNYGLRPMAMLFPPFDADGEPAQKFEELKLSVTPYTDDKLDDPARDVVLTIVGASDEYYTPGRYRTSIMLTLQPWNWHHVSYMQTSWGGEHIIRDLSQLATKSFAFEIPPPVDREHFIRQHMSHSPELRTKISGLQVLAESVGKVDLAPVYGHRVPQGQGLRFALSLATAVNRRPELFQKPIVVPVFNEGTGWVNTLNRTQNEIDLRHLIRVARIEDPKLTDKIRNLIPGGVLMVVVGRVAKPVFEMMFAETTIAALAEGRNSMNLMALAGQPFLPSWEREGYPWPQVPPLAESAFTQFNGISSDAPLDPDSAGTVALANFFIDVRSPHSQTREFFARNKVDANDYDNDKLYLGLRVVERELRARKKNCDLELRGDHFDL